MSKLNTLPREAQPVFNGYQAVPIVDGTATGYKTGTPSALVNKKKRKKKKKGSR